MYLCHVTQLPDDGARGFDTGGAGQATIFLLRRGDQVRAWHDSCPHHGTPLPWRRDAYLDAYHRSVWQLVQEGFLLSEDASKLLATAEAVPFER